jgi:hypothetical protein
VRRIRTTALRLSGHAGKGPSGVEAQSKPSTSRGISCRVVGSRPVAFTRSPGPMSCCIEPISQEQYARYCCEIPRHTQRERVPIPALEPFQTLLELPMRGLQLNLRCAEFSRSCLKFGFLRGWAYVARDPLDIPSTHRRRLLLECRLLVSERPARLTGHRTFHFR